MVFCQSIPQDVFACYLFSYQGNVVAIDLVGAGIPLIASGLICVILLRRAKWRVNPRRIALLFSFTVILGLLSALEFVGFMFHGPSKVFVGLEPY